MHVGISLLFIVFICTTAASALEFKDIDPSVYSGFQHINGEKITKV